MSDTPATRASDAPTAANGPTGGHGEGGAGAGPTAARTTARKEITIAIDDGVYLNPIATGQISLSDERQAMTDLAALLRDAAKSVEAERDREFPDEEPDHG
ncbi:hypothetical protein [Actinomadura sp. WMMA1423]|uniref:hypothetical protein n=1 Tax=Actinomadura sp. WMMA1423 TaxID=2591108 RepID=UPI0011470713|nr:hypothetical protein [Actinomadura sp. WMMA1423]